MLLCQQIIGLTANKMAENLGSIISLIFFIVCSIESPLSQLIHIFSSYPSWKNRISMLLDLDGVKGEFLSFVLNVFDSHMLSYLGFGAAVCRYDGYT